DVFIGCVCIFFFFFFQAEDGIRDRNVTGVQTCALPICADRARGANAARLPSGARGAPASRPRGPRPSAGVPHPHPPGGRAPGAEIGRASCRERVEIWGVAGAVEKKEKYTNSNSNNEQAA